MDEKSHTIKSLRKQNKTKHKTIIKTKPQQPAKLKNASR